MPALADRTKEARKTLILKELLQDDGCKDLRDISSKYGWSHDVTSELAGQLDTEIEQLNTFHRAVLTVKAGPKSVERVMDAVKEGYDEPDHKLRAGELGLRTLKALDPKLRTQQIDLKHSGNVLLTISQANSKDSQAVEAMFEVVDTIKSSEG